MSTKPVYRPIFLRALKIVWQHKIFWVFGILASIINTGAVFAIAFRALRPINYSGSFSELILANMIPGFETFRLYLSQFLLVSPLRAVISLLVIIILIAILITVAVYSQAAIIKGSLGRGKKTWRKLVEIPGKTAGRIFVINLTAKVVVSLLLALSAIPLALLSTHLLGNLLASFVVLVFFMTIILIVSLLTLLAVTSVVQNKNKLIEAIEEAINIFRKHPLVTFETALLLFLVHLASVLLGILILLILWLPYTALFYLATIIGTTVLTTIVSLLITLLGLLLILVLTGFVVAYQLAVWAIVYDKLRARGLIPKLHRFRKNFRLL